MDGWMDDPPTSVLDLPLERVIVWASSSMRVYVSIVRVYASVVDLPDPMDFGPDK